MTVVHGLDARQGDTQHAFCVLRMAVPASRAQVDALVHHLAPLVRDADGYLAGLPEDFDEPWKLIALPWSPPEAGTAVEVQHRLIEGAPAVGVEVAWFIQCGTRLVRVDGGDDDEDEDEDDDAEEEQGARAATSTDDEWDLDADTGAQQLIAADEDDDEDDEDDDGEDEDEDEDDEDDDSDEDVAWSHGEPPQRTDIGAPVDGYPAIIAEFDWEDFGITVKLAGPHVAGEDAVLQAFHALWLAPYAGRFRNTDATYDAKHHAVHFWVDRFFVLRPDEEQIHYLMWVVAQLGTVVPVGARRGSPARRWRTSTAARSATTARRSCSAATRCSPRIARPAERRQAMPRSTRSSPSRGTGARASWRRCCASWRSRSSRAAATTLRARTSGDEDAADEADDDEDGEDDDDDDDDDDADDDGDDVSADAEADDDAEVVDAIFEAEVAPTPPEAIAALAVQILAARARRGALAARAVATLHAAVEAGGGRGGRGLRRCSATAHAWPLPSPAMTRTTTTTACSTSTPSSSTTPTTRTMTRTATTATATT